MDKIDLGPVLAICKVGDSPGRNLPGGVPEKKYSLQQSLIRIDMKEVCACEIKSMCIDMLSLNWHFVETVLRACVCAYNVCVYNEILDIVCVLFRVDRLCLCVVCGVLTRRARQQCLMRTALNGE